MGQESHVQRMVDPDNRYRTHVEQSDDPSDSPDQLADTYDRSEEF